ncbi:hypothetical protein H6P81_021690 [Aristolochia fimbriata]|uniref:Uncharacterized protein n=1 Tax=Aristolochia fimbriata TaxID=158543 RepID=A0AAV7DQY9_ARIFI|nr:hypothetical protein H6P81_021690 [Aristolochia fimbriata]
MLLLVVVQLLDDECPEDFINLTLSVSFLPEDPLVEQCEKRLRCELLETRSNCFRVYILPRPLAAKEYPQQLELMPALDCLSNLNHMKDRTSSSGHICAPGLTLSVRSFLPDDPLVQQCEKRLRDASYLKRDQLLCIYIAKATGIVAAFGFPVVVGERLDLDIHFMYIEGAAKTGQIKDVKVSYPLPCMPTTCFDILKDMGKKVNPGNAPLVVVQLCDDECPEDFIKVLLYLSVLSFQMILLFSNVRRGLTLSVRSFLPDDPLVQQCEKRLRDASYLKRDELLRIYIAKATGIVAADGFPVVVGER